MDWKSFVVGMVTATLVACGGSKKSAVEPAPATSSTLWSLAPADSVAGVVVADGTLMTARAWALEAIRIAELRPESKAFAGELKRELGMMPFDPFDDASIKQAGLDLSKGAAVFVNQADEMSIIMPVGDRQAFAGLLGGSTTMEGGVEVETFQGGQMRCKMSGDRYMCAPTAERLAMIGAAPTNALAEAANALPENLRGDAQMLVDAQRYRPGSAFDSIDRYVTDAGIFVASASMSQGRFTVRAHLPGALVGAGKKLAEAPSSLVGKIASERPSSFMRVRMDPNDLPREDGSMFGINPNDLMSALTGEMVAFSHAGAAASLGVQVGLSASDTFSKLLKMGCGMAGGFVNFLDSKLEGETCKGVVNLGKADPMLTELLLPKQVDIDVRVDADRVDSRFSLGKRGPVDTAPSPSKLGSELLSAGWNVAMWAEGLSPIYAFDIINPAAIKKLGVQERALAWMLGHVYEAGMGIGFRNDGIHGVFEISSFAVGGEATLATYQKAYGMALDGDVAGAKAALTAAAKGDADGILARQTASGGGAWVGALAGLGYFMTGGVMEDTSVAPATTVPAPVPVPTP